MASMPGLLKEPCGPSHRRPTPDSGISLRSESRHSGSFSTVSEETSFLCTTNDDIQDTESGVHEQDYNEWIFQDYGENVDLDLTPDQVRATLRYFTSTAERANMLTKTHYDDLDVISNLLQEKEKDLELAANIGQSLLQRNKDLLLKIEAMEDFLTQASEREVQLCHEVQLKNKLIKHMLIEEAELEEQTLSSTSSKGIGEISCKDESITLLQERCKTLEKKNNDLFSEALSVKRLTDEAENKEQQLVMDCVRQLAEAKDQITNLTDEIALKFEDNVQQQEEITELITTVVELQRNHRQLSTENEELQVQLDESQQNQEFLRSQVVELQRKFCECYELLQNNQEEMKSLRSKVELNEQSSWASESCSSGFYQDSIAMEIEESVRKDLTAAENRRRQDNKVWDTVRCANRLMDRGLEPRPASGRLSPLSGSRSDVHSFMSDASSVSDTGSVTNSGMFDGQESATTRRRRPYAPERLQIVKPMEGSQTLHQWQHLASQSVNAGLNLTKSPTSSPEDKNDSEIRLEDLEDDIFHEDDASTADEGISFTVKPSSPANPLPAAVRVSKKAPVINPPRPVVVKARTALPVKNKSSTPKFSSDVPENLMFLTTRPDTMALSDGGSVHSGSSSLKPEDVAQAATGKAGAKPRTIITRSSSILASLREGREMLNQHDNGKSKAEVIDILANAMNKVNVEAKTGKRILESISASNVRDRTQSASRTPAKKDYPSMPKLTKVLEKLAASKMEETGSADGKLSLRDLIQNMDKAKAIQERSSTKTESVHAPNVFGTIGTAPFSGASGMLPTLLRGTLQVGRSSTPSILGRMVRSSSHDMPPSVPSEGSLSALAGSDRSLGHRTLTKSLSSGDLQKFATENLSKLGVIDPGITSSAVSLGRTRRNSSGESMGSIASLDGVQGFGLKRRNSSGNLAELSRNSEDGARSGLPASSLSSFDPYGISEYFSGDDKGRPASARGVVAIPKVPSGFLKNLFLGSGHTNDNRMQEPKRPSSVCEKARDTNDPTKGAASTSSAESGLDKVGRSFNIGDSFGGLGFMNFFGNRSSSSNDKK